MTGAELNGGLYGRKDFVLVPSGFDFGDYRRNGVARYLTGKRAFDTVAEQQVLMACSSSLPST